MKTALLFLLISCLTQATTYAQDFEGRFVQRITTIGPDDLYEAMGVDLYGEDQANLSELLLDLDVNELVTMGNAEIEDIRILVRGDLTRVQPDLDGDVPGYQIINSRTGTIWLVNATDKTYVEFTRQSAEDMEKKAREMMEKMGIDPEQAEDMAEYGPEAGTTEPTGRTAEINGYQANAYTYTDEETVEIGWCATEQSDFFAAMKQRAMEGVFEGEEDEEGGVLECPEDTFPVRTISYDAYGQELVIDDLIDVKAESLPAALFEVPDGYTKKDFMGGFLGN